jgi:hypothetical protein
MLILKQNAANTVPTPPAGKGTIFLNPSDDLAVKTADGNITVFPTAAGANTQVYFNDDGSFGANANLVFNKATSVLTVTGNVAATRVLTDNLLYANGTAWDLSDPGGSNTQIQFNDDESFGGSAAFTFNKSSNLVSMGGALSVTGNANVGNIGATNGVFTNVSGNGSSLSSITGANVSGAVAFATTANAVAGANVSGAVSFATTANAVAGANVSGEVSFAATANAVAGGNVSGQVGNALVAGTVYTNAQPNITSVGTLTSLAVTGNATAGNVYANSGTIGASLLTGTLTTAAQPNVTSVGTLSSLTATGNVAAGNLTTTGVLSVTGTGVSSIAGNLDMTSNNIINLATPVNSTDAATKQYVDDVAQGLNVHDSCQAATQTTLATISGGTVTYNNGTAGVGATLTTTGTYTTIDGVTLSNGMRILVKNEATAANNGVYVRTSATVLTRATDYDTVPEVEAGDFVFVTGGTLYDNTGWVQTSTVVTIGTDPIDFTQFSGAGTYQAGTGLTLTGSTFSVNASQTQVTSVGTLTGLGVNGTITAANITANTGVFTGNGSGLSAIAGANVTGAVAFATTANAVAGANVSGAVSFATTANAVAGANVSGTVSSATTAGTVTTAAQPNITSTGTLTALTVTGNISAGNVSATTFTGALSGAATSATTAGTVTTAAQPNITSVGTLTGLTLSGTLTGAVQIGTGTATHFGTTLTTGANSTAGTITGNWSLSAGSRLNATYADIAEKYVADATYEPGTVLLFGGEHEVTLSTAFDSTKVAGVVTTNPAYSMNSALEAEYVAEIALQGRVPVKVTGTIAKGDLLVSASNGHAVANNEARAGTIIGKSLENFTGESGVIEVAVGRF